MEIIFVIFLVWGGYELGNKDSKEEVVESKPIETETSNKAYFERGHYYETDAGYWISNLTPKPKLPDGCNNPVVTADLSSSIKVGKQRKVTIVEMSCEG